jgi:hypothetical protein
MFEWLFLLKIYNIKYFEIFGITLVNYLNSLNTESIYYNLMTHKILTKKLNNEKCFLDDIFTIK